MLTTAPSATSCPRCRGLLVVEHIAWEHRQIYCVMCGYRTCPLIDENRALSSSPTHHQTQNRKFPVRLDT